MYQPAAFGGVSAFPSGIEKGSDRNDPKSWYVSVDGPDDPENWEQDEDVLDTWASSNLWPFATFGWPNPSEKESEELHYYYPTDGARYRF